MWYDVLILAILLLATIRGAMKGFVWQVAAIGAIVLCFLFAESLSVQLAPMIKVQEPLNRWIAMAILYIGFAFGCFLLARQLRGWLEKARFQEFDRHLGGIFGLIKGALFCLVLTFFMITLAESLRADVLASYSGQAAKTVMLQLEPVLPKELQSVLEPYIEQLAPGHVHAFAHGDDHHGHKPGQGEKPADKEDSLLGTLWKLVGGKEKPKPGAVPSQPSTLPGLSMDHDTLAILLAAVQRAEPEQRAMLEDKILNMTPEELSEFRQLIQTIRRESPSTAQTQTTTNSNARQRKDELMQKIAAWLIDSPRLQANMVRDMTESLEGIPEPVAIATLQDWWADLQPDRGGLGADPEPETHIATDLKDRIRRHLDSANIPITSLSPAAQRRLQ